MKKWLKVAFFVVGGILLLVVLLSLMAGPLAKRYAEKHSVELCHRVATMDKVRINLFNGTVSIDALKVLEEDGKTSFLSFNKLKVNASLMKLMAKEVKITGIYLDGLDAKVVQDGNRFNFSDIIELYSKKPKKEKDDTPSQWAVNLMDIQIHNSAIQYRDAQIGSHFGLKNLDLVIPQLYLAGGHSDINLDLDFDKGGNLALRLLYDIQKGDYNLNVKMSRFNVDAVQPYLSNSFAVTDCRGLLTGDISVKGSLQHILNMVASGNLSFEKLKANNGDGSPLLSANSLKINVKSVDLQKKSYHIEQVELQDPVFYYDLFKDGNTLTRLMKPRTPSSNSSDTPKDTLTSSKSITYYLKSLSVKNGRVVYQDHTLPQKMIFPVNSINVSINDLSQDNMASVSINALLGASGRMSCSGQLNPLDLKNATLSLNIENLAIKEFSPYASYYLAYPIEDGLLSFSSQDVIKSNWLNSNNTLDIYKPTFGNKQKDAQPKANIPMKAAMYLITDRKGHVRMDLPVSGDITSPTFSFRKIIWKTFTNLLVKVMLSPVDFFSNIVGDNPFKTMQLPLNEPLQLSMENTHQLNAIADAMKEKEQMHLLLRVGCGETDAEQNCTQLRQQGYEIVRNYLLSQGIDASRIQSGLDEETSGKNGSLSIMFNIEIPE